MKIHKTAKALGWFSIALGVTEIVAAKRYPQITQIDTDYGKTGQAN